MRKLLYALISLILLLSVTAAIASMQYFRFLEKPLTLEKNDSVLLLKPGTSYRGLTQSLKQRGWTEQSLAWRVLGIISPLASRLQAGEYQIKEGTTPEQLLRQLAEGEVLLHDFTIIEGWTVRQLLQAIAEQPAIHGVLDIDDPEYISELLDIEQENPEGWFLPETYHFPRGETDLAILKRAHQAMKLTLEQAWESRDQGLPYKNSFEALIMASIIEKETGLKSERKLISGVFVRRLDKGMRLQTDPTVIYGLGENFDGDIRYRDLRTDTPYNTYTRSGLPPTPIALAGQAAIEAALHPAPGNALYFVAKGDGSHQFSSTLKAHNAAVDRYQRGGQ